MSYKSWWARYLDYCLKIQGLNTISELTIGYHSIRFKKIHIKRTYILLRIKTFVWKSNSLRFVKKTENLLFLIIIIIIIIRTKSN